jgi:hypothetical protein
LTKALSITRGSLSKSKCLRQHYRYYYKCHFLYLKFEEGKWLVDLNMMMMMDDMMMMMMIYINNTC